MTIYTTTLICIKNLQNKYVPTTMMWFGQCNNTPQRKYVHSTSGNFPQPEENFKVSIIENPYVISLHPHHATSFVIYSSTINVEPISGFQVIIVKQLRPAIFWFCSLLSRIDINIWLVYCLHLLKPAMTNDFRFKYVLWNNSNCCYCTSTVI